MDITKYTQYIMLGIIGVLLFLSSILFYMYEIKIEEIAKLEAEKQILNSNQDLLSQTIDRQNLIIKELEVKETLVDSSKLLEIQIEDESCEAELKAYKSLFKELSQ